MNKFGKYWICAACAKKKGGKEHDSNHTVVRGFCSWCESKEKTTLVPLRDFHWESGDWPEYKEEE